MLTRILCATDGSEHADRALRYATHLASDQGAELHIVHVIETLTIGRLAGQNVYLNEAEIKSKITHQAAEITRSQGAHTTLHSTKGNANRLEQRIAEIADNVDADIIVIGTHGRAPLAGLLLGSVTAQLLHVTHRPVLALPPTGN
jgi:universal stress protein A